MCTSGDKQKWFIDRYKIRDGVFEAQKNPKIIRQKTSVDHQHL